MAGSGASAAEMLSQLESARKLALQDPQVYSQIIPGIVPIIQPGALLEVRRWGAEFLAEGFASPALPAAQKEQLTADVLPLLKGMLDNPTEDLTVVRSAIQACASIYPLFFRRIISHPDQALMWQDMTAVKLNIQGRMDTSPTSVKIVCIKFLQKVVQVQTPGLIADPRRPDQNEISIALVPRNHPLLPLPNIEAEASGLLDRLLSVIQEQSSDPLIVDATMNSLAVLLKTRPPVANKILSTIVTYNPFQTATTSLTARQIVVFKSLERTTRALLHYVLRIFPSHPMEQKIRSYLSRLQQSRTALFSDSHSLKRPAEPSDGMDDAKRQRLRYEPGRFPPMPPPPNSYGQLFTLTEDTILQQFDAKLLGADMVSNIVGLLLQHIDSKTLDEAVEGVRRRWEHIQKTSIPTPVPDVPMAGPTGIDDDDDYDPEYIGTGDTVVSPATQNALEELAQPVFDLGPFELPKPPPLSMTEVAILSDQSVSRVFDIANSFDRVPPSGRQKSGLNRLAAGAHDREAWVTILTRLATRAPAGLDDLVASMTTPDETDETNGTDPSSLQHELATDRASSAETANMSSRIRQTLFHYILEDWKARLNIAISWLTEEWYADRIAQRSLPTSSLKAISPRSNGTGEVLGQAPSNKDRKAIIRKSGLEEGEEAQHDSLPNYNRTLTRLLTHLLPRFDSTDSKLLIRFLSEIPALTPPILAQVRSLARDPGTVKICLLALQYLLMFRPPVRGMVIDCLIDVWREGEEGVRVDVGKVLGKWRPGWEEEVRKKGAQEEQEEEEEEEEEEEKEKEVLNGDAVEEYMPDAGEQARIENGVGVAQATATGTATSMTGEPLQSTTTTTEEVDDRLSTPLQAQGLSI